MSSKLESLVKILATEGISQSSLDKLILDYFDKQYSDNFATADGEVYEVYTKGEVEDQLYDIAADLFDDYRLELRKLIRYADNEYHLKLIVDSIDKYACCTELAEELDYEDELKKNLIGSDDTYFVYAEA